MKISALFVLLVVILFSVGVAAAQPENGANAYSIVYISCEDGFEGSVLAPTSPAAAFFLVPGFFYSDGVEIAGLGLIREVTITSGGTVVYHYQFPGQGYDTVTCGYEFPPYEYQVEVMLIYNGMGG